MLPLQPAYLADAPLDDHTLGIVRFASTTALRDGVLTIALPSRATAAAEVWRSPVPVMRGERSGIAFAHNSDVLFGALVSMDADLAAGARRAYESIVRVTRGEGFPFLLRIWNHVRGINAGEADEERYRVFCTGRHEALTTAGLQKSDFPSASAVGMRDGQLAIYFIAARAAGRQVENPRQVSAYDYPREYGPRSPSFARATVARFGGRELVFVSGTASVVGHQTKHPGDLDAQLGETIVNLEHILTESGVTATDVRTVKIYLRRAETGERIVSSLATEFPGASLLPVESDICRRDLLLEVEAVAVK